MNHKQISILFFCNFVVFFIGGALLPLLPLYAGQYGATATVAGLYLAIIYLAIASGTMLTGWLSDRLPAKALFIGTGALGLPALILHIYATRLWQIILLTSVVWFFAGVGTAMTSILTGLSADKKRRAKSFGLMFLARPLGGVVGGLAAGQLVSWGGYPLLFTVLSIVWAGWPLSGFFGLEHRSTATPPATSAAEGVTPLRRDYAFYGLLLVTLLSTTVLYGGRLGTSLSMEALDFTPSAIALTTAIGSLVMIPATLMIGSLSDRLGRRSFLVLSYLLAAGGALLLSAATELWQFSLATVLLFMVNSANGSVGAAFATDLLDKEALSRGLSWLNGMMWLGGIGGFAGAGYITDAFGSTTVYLVAATMAMSSTVLLGLLPRERQAPLPRRSRESSQTLALVAK